MSKDVKLNISATEKTGNGWESAEASNNVTYWYKFTGGNGSGDNGNNGFDTGTAESFSVTFKGQDGNTYAFVSVKTKETPTDLGGSVDTATNTATVTDTCVNEGTFTWGVNVKVKGSDPAVTFLCDPAVTNTRRGPGM